MTLHVGDAKIVGPVLRGIDADVVDAVIEAIRVDNPDADVIVDDQGGYVRVGVDGRCRLTRASLEDAMGVTFPLSSLEPSLASFAGRVRMNDDEIVWYLERGRE